MLSFLPLQPEHLLYLNPVADQTEDYKSLLGPSGIELLSLSIGHSAWASNHCLGLAGILPIWPGRAEAWTLMGCDARDYTLPIVRRMRTILDLYQRDCRRIEMTVKEGNELGHRLARMLGFTCETPQPLKAYHPSGCNMFMYARVK